MDWLIVLLLLGTTALVFVIFLACKCCRGWKFPSALTNRLKSGSLFSSTFQADQKRRIQKRQRPLHLAWFTKRNYGGRAAEDDSGIDDRQSISTFSTSTASIGSRVVPAPFGIVNLRSGQPPPQKSPRISIFRFSIERVPSPAATKKKAGKMPKLDETSDATQKKKSLNIVAGIRRSKSLQSLNRLWGGISTARKVGPSTVVKVQPIYNPKFNESAQAGEDTIILKVDEVSSGSQGDNKGLLEGPVGSACLHTTANSQRSPKLIKQQSSRRSNIAYRASLSTVTMGSSSEFFDVSLSDDDNKSESNDNNNNKYIALNMTGENAGFFDVGPGPKENTTKTQKRKLSPLAMFPKLLGKTCSNNPTMATNKAETKSGSWRWSSTATPAGKEFSGMERLKRSRSKGNGLEKY